MTRMTGMKTYASRITIKIPLWDVDLLPGKGLVPDNQLLLPTGRRLLIVHRKGLCLFHQSITRWHLVQTSIMLLRRIRLMRRFMFMLHVLFRIVLLHGVLLLVPYHSGRLFLGLLLARLSICRWSIFMTKGIQ